MTKRGLRGPRLVLVWAALGALAGGPAAAVPSPAPRCDENRSTVAQGLVERPALLKVVCGPVWARERQAVTYGQWVETYTVDRAQASAVHRLLTEKFQQRGYVVIRDTPFSNNGRFTLYGTGAPGIGVMVNVRRPEGDRSVVVVTGPYSVLSR